MRLEDNQPPSSAGELVKSAAAATWMNRSLLLVLRPLSLLLGTVQVASEPQEWSLAELDVPPQNGLLVSELQKEATSQCRNS